MGYVVFVQAVNLGHEYPFCYELHDWLSGTMLFQSDLFYAFSAAPYKTYSQEIRANRKVFKAIIALLF
jgi:hypothetical protein